VEWAVDSWPRDETDLPARNRRTALVLIGVIAVLMVLSVAVVWVRN